MSGINWGEELAMLLVSALILTPFAAALSWLAGKFMFKKMAPSDRAKMVPAVLWLGWSAITWIQGNALFSLISAPSFVIVWAVWSWLLRSNKAA